MLEIDFLPAQYRRRQARQRSKPWHAIVVFGFAVLVGAAAVGQYRNRSRLQAELSLLQPQYEQAVAMTAELERLQEELKHARAEAALITYLRHPWPRTQLLQALLEPLPSAIVLTELEITHQSRAMRRDPQPQRLQTDAHEPPVASMPRAERDLVALRENADAVQTVLRVAGTTDDSAALHRYLGSLARHRLFHKTELESIESTENPAGKGVRFRCTVVVRPGYGQPGGPTGPEHQSLARHVGP